MSEPHLTDAAISEQDDVRRTGVELLRVAIGAGVTAHNDDLFVGGERVRRSEPEGSPREVRHPFQESKDRISALVRSGQP